MLILFFPSCAHADFSRTITSHSLPPSVKDSHRRGGAYKPGDLHWIDPCV